MRNFSAFILLLVLLFAGGLRGQDSLRYLPTARGQVIDHGTFILSYNEQYEQAEWVYYWLDSTDINPRIKRRDDFREDPLVSTGSASLEDYAGSGYDRGHLCPAADSQSSEESMSTSFYLSNMSPQSPSFNRGIWRKLEALFRDWAIHYRGLYVVTAGVLNPDLSLMGPNEVAIPMYYYKLAYNPHLNSMIAFSLENKGSSKDLNDFVITVDSLEALSGIDFFPGISGEQDLESKLDTLNWDFDVQVVFKPSKVSNQSSEAVQCKGEAKSSGERCRQMTRNENAYCRYHQKQAGG